MAFGLDDLALGATVLGGLGSTGLLGKQFKQLSPALGLGGLAYGAYNSYSNPNGYLNPENSSGLFGDGGGSASASVVPQIKVAPTTPTNFGTPFASPSLIGSASTSTPPASPVANTLGGFGNINMETGAKLLGAGGQIYGAYNQSQLANKQMNMAQANYNDDKNYYRNNIAQNTKAINDGFGKAYR